MAFRVVHDLLTDTRIVLPQILYKNEQGEYLLVDEGEEPPAGYKAASEEEFFLTNQ